LFIDWRTMENNFFGSPESLIFKGFRVFWAFFSMLLSVPNISAKSPETLIFKASLKVLKNGKK